MTFVILDNGKNRNILRLLFVCLFLLLAYTYILSLQDVLRSCLYFVSFTSVEGKRFLVDTLSGFSLVFV